MKNKLIPTFNINLPIKEFNLPDNIYIDGYHITNKHSIYDDLIDANYLLYFQLYNKRRLKNVVDLIKSKPQLIEAFKIINDADKFIKLMDSNKLENFLKLKCLL